MAEKNIEKKLRELLYNAESEWLKCSRCESLQFGQQAQNCPMDGQPVAPTEGPDGIASAGQAAAAVQHRTSDVSPFINRTLITGQHVFSHTSHLPKFVLRFFEQITEDAAIVLGLRSGDPVVVVCKQQNIKWIR